MLFLACASAHASAPHGAAGNRSRALTLPVTALHLCHRREYLEVRRRLRLLRKVTAEYKRPVPGGVHDVTHMTSGGRFSKVPPYLRLVDEEEDCWVHLEKAKRLRFPQKEFSSQLGQVYIEAAERMAELGEELERLRYEWAAEFVALALLLELLLALLLELLLTVAASSGVVVLSSSAFFASPWKGQTTSSDCRTQYIAGMATSSGWGSLGVPNFAGPRQTGHASAFSAHVRHRI